MSPGGAQPVSRFNFRFATGGSRAACLAARGGQGWLEGWELTGQGPRRWLRVPFAGDLAAGYPLPVAGDRLLLAERRDGRQWLSLIGRSGTLAARPVPDLWLTGGPAGSGLALGLAATPDGGTEVFRIEPDPAPGGAGWCTPVAGCGWALRGPVVVTADRVLLHTRSAGVAVPVVLDPHTGTLAPVPLPPGIQGAVPVSAAGDRLLLAVVAGGRHRVAIAPLARPGPDQPGGPDLAGGLDLLPGLDRLDGSVGPLALDPTGTELALRVRTGIRSRLLRHRPATRDTREIAAPAGTAAPKAAWPDGGLWLPYTTTSAPTRLWWLPPGGQELRGQPGATAAGRPGRVEVLPGADGPIEAICYGDWRTSERVVLALHGGPAAHWALGYDPTLHGFAAAGLAVVAPNQRGSTGYDQPHQDAIRGAWGGPDLADLVTLAAHLIRVRGDGRAKPALFGTSYGAFLGLLGLADAPELWSGCVAVSPFLSGARLYAEAAPPVRALLDRLDGARVLVTTAGPRDLLWLAPRIRGRVLVVHGDRDGTIPVGQSRTLVAALSGRPDLRVRYRELPGRDHDPVRPARHAPEFAEIVAFLSGVDTTGPADAPAQLAQPSDPTEGGERDDATRAGVRSGRAGTAAG